MIKTKLFVLAAFCSLTVVTVSAWDCTGMGQKDCICGPWNNHCNGPPPRKPNGNDDKGDSRTDHGGLRGLPPAPLVSPLDNAKMYYLYKKDWAVNVVLKQHTRAMCSTQTAKECDEHISRILRNLPAEHLLDSLEDVYLAADELADYFDGYRLEYKDKYDLIVVNLPAQIKRDEELADEIERFNDSLNSDHAFRQKISALSSEKEHLQQQLDATAKRFDESSEHYASFLQKRNEVAARVLKRINKPLPVRYIAPDVLSPSLYTTDAERQALYGLKSCCRLEPGQDVHRDDPHKISPFPDPPNPLKLTRKEVEDIVTPLPSGSLESMVDDRAIDVRNSALALSASLGGKSGGYLYYNPEKILWHAREASDRLQSVPKEQYLLAEKTKRWIDVANRTLEEAQGPLHDSLQYTLGMYLRATVWEYLESVTERVHNAYVLSRVEWETVRFSDDEMELIERGAKAIAEYDPTEIDRVKREIDRRLCSYEKNVDDKVFPLDERFKAWTPPTESVCNH